MVITPLAIFAAVLASPDENLDLMRYLVLGLLICGIMFSLRTTAAGQPLAYVEQHVVLSFTCCSTSHPPTQSVFAGLYRDWRGADHDASSATATSPKPTASSVLPPRATNCAPAANCTARWRKIYRSRRCCCSTTICVFCWSKDARRKLVIPKLRSKAKQSTRRSTQRMRRPFATPILPRWRAKKRSPSGVINDQIYTRALSAGQK